MPRTPLTRSETHPRGRHLERWRVHLIEAVDAGPAGLLGATGLTLAAVSMTALLLGVLDLTSGPREASEWELVACGVAGLFLAGVLGGIGIGGPASDDVRSAGRATQ